MNIHRDISSQLFHWDKLISGNTIYRYPQLAASVIVFKNCGHVPSQATVASANLAKNSLLTHSTGSSVRNRSYRSDRCKQSCYLRKSSWLVWEETFVAFILQYLLLWVYYRAVHSDTPPWLLSAKNGWSCIEFVEGLGIFCHAEWVNDITVRFLTSTGQGVISSLSMLCLYAELIICRVNNSIVPFERPAMFKQNTWHSTHRGRIWKPAKNQKR